MEPQEIFNVLIGACLGLIAYIGQGMRASLLKLEKTDKDLADKVQRMEVIVAGDYVKREALNHQFEKVESQLERIETKLTDHITKQDG